MNKNIYRTLAFAWLITICFSGLSQNATAITTIAPSTPYLTGVATIGHFNCSITGKRVNLGWSVEKNENADQFIVEKSTDGKNFAMVALVFGTDKAGLDDYMFYEKVGNRKSTYRIKILHRDATASWSEALAAVPAN